MNTLEIATDLKKSHMEKTVQLSLEHVDKGGVPFSALIVDEHGNVLAKGVNQVNELCDPTAHAEIMAIREAAKQLGVASLAGSTLYASGEPCALCYMAARWAGITQVYVASDRHEAADAGFDYRWSYYFFNAGEPDSSMKVNKLIVDEFNAPFEQWSRLR